MRFTLLSELPPLRMRLILDNLAGHKTPALVCWLMRQGSCPSTPLRWQLAQHGRVRAADFSAARTGGATCSQPPASHLLAGVGGTGLEPSADAVCVGWEAQGTTGAGVAMPAWVE